MREVIPQPGYTVGDVEAAMASRSFRFTDCFTIVPVKGTEMRYTNYQQDVSVIPNTGGPAYVRYRSNKINIMGLRVRASVGLEVDEQELALDYTNEPIFQAQLPWGEALLNGRLDGAHVRRDRFIAGPNGKWIGGFPMFSGLVSTLSSVGRQSASLKVKSDIVLLDMNMPKDLFESNCKNVWGDPVCGVIQDDWAVLGVAGVGVTRTYIPWTDASSEYAMGKIYMSNGDTTTRVRTIARANDDGLFLSYPLDFDPEPGFTFTAYPGCNRTKERCPHFHGDEWRRHFKGFPYVPVAETALG